MQLVSQLCFAVFLVSLPSRQAEGSSSRLSPHNNNGGFNDETRCSWNCTIIDSDLPEQWKTVSTKHRLIKLVAEFEKKVTEQCAKQASRNSSGNATEYFNVWLPPNNKLSSFHHAMDRLFNLIFSPHPEKHVKVKGVCQLRPLKTGSQEAISSSNRDVLPRFVRSHLADHGLEVQSGNCNAEMNDSQPCIDASKTNLNSYHGLFSKGNRWLDIAFYVLVFVFLVVFVHYSPAIICLFPSTVVTENGIRHIVLGGASPVSLRSVVGNFFHSERDTIWQKVKILFLRIVLLPLPFLSLGIGFDYINNHSKNSISPVSFAPFLFSQAMIFCYVCYAVLTIRDLLWKTTRKSKPCGVCRTIKPVPNFICNDVLPRRLLNHLRLQPLILVTAWRSFVTYPVDIYCKLSQTILPSVSWFVRFPVVLVAFLLIFPVVVLISLGKMSWAITAGIFTTSPIVILCNATSLMGSNSDSLVRRILGVFGGICVRMPAIFGGVSLLLFDAFCILLVMDSAFALLFSEDSLPYVSLLVLVCYYLWSGYSSFTNKYHDLSLILFKCYQAEYRHDQNSNVAAAVDVVTTDPAQVESTESTRSPNNKGHVMKIPKELFEMACEELMPVRQSVCGLFLKIISILIFVFLVFLWIMKSKPGATPQMKAVLTFFTGSFPKIVEIYIDGARKRRLEAMVTEERAPNIVQNFITRSASADQEQDISATNTEEVIIVNGNEEPVQLVNVETS